MAAKPMPTGYGTFCWSQLNASDLGVCERFYSGLLGWSILHESVGGMPLTLFLSGKDQVASAMQIPVQGAEPPRSHWMSYVWVQDLEATFAKAGILGATVHVPPTPIPGIGRFAVLGDPGGAVFGVFEQDRDPGTPMPTGPGTFCWYELTTRAGEKSIAFYAALFGWTTQEWPMEAGIYTLFLNGGEAVAGLMSMAGPEWEGVPNHWMPYLAVSDVDERFAAVTALGGAECVPPTDLPEVGRFAVVNDPAGGVFSLFRGV